MHQSDFFSEPARQMLPTLIAGRATSVTGDDGTRYWDAASGAILTNLGQGNRRVIKAMGRQARELSFTYVRNSRHRPNEALVGRLQKLNQSGYEAVYLSTDGSDAIEVALKIARAVAVARGEHDRVGVLSLRPSYHGATLATLPLAGDDDYRPFADLVAMRAVQVDSPFARSRQGEDPAEAAERSLDALRSAILELGPGRVLAVIVEPIGGVSNGAYALPLPYLRGLRQLCTEHGIQLVFDEIMAHIRTGWFLTADRLDADDRPDMVAIGKGLGAGYTPIAATLIGDGLHRDLVAGPGFNLSHTYNANPISCAAACAVLDEVERRGLVRAAREKGAELMGALRELQVDGSGIEEVRGEGLLIAVQVAPGAGTADGPSSSELVRRAALDEGLLVYARDTNGGRYGYWVMVAPPLTVTARGLREIVTRFRRAVERGLHGG